ncbi:MAG TPA: dihydroorotate dehydrogenase (quinone) [Candidatus Saccharimonadales bacterium]|nr:dihydroorotate dehydrogenase (quinone) [Candidatus Saccharimonadales bacterium]
MRAYERLEYWKSEGLKTTVERSLHEVSQRSIGNRALGLVRGGPRIEDERLHTSVAGIEMENPVMVGAGWDKQGRAIDALIELGFGGVEVGTVLMFPQAGNPKPRMELDASHSVGRNSLGFNAPGVDVVEDNLRTQRRSGVIGINVGKNKLLPDELAPWAHAAVVERLHGYGDYIVINVSSPNTPGLRDFLTAARQEELRTIIREVQAVNQSKGRKPLFIKLTVDMDITDVYRLLELCAEEEVDGVIDTNTTVDQTLKAKYGWGDKPGGLSGNDSEYRARADRRMADITNFVLKNELGLTRIGVGAINDAGSAINRLKNGAEAVQVVTALAQTKLRAAEQIKKGLLDHLDAHNLSSVGELVGENL